MTETRGGGRCGAKGPPRHERPPRAAKLDPFRAEIRRLLDEDAAIPGKRVREME
jgi:hypothetical protein